MADDIFANWPAVASAIEHGRAVFLVPDDGAVECLTRFRLTATCTGLPVGRWSTKHTVALSQAKTIVIIPDNAPAHARHAERVAAMLPQSVILRLPGLAPGTGVAAWIDAGGTDADIRNLTQAAVKAKLDAPKQHDPEPDAPFQVLGHSDGVFYFLPARGGQVVALGARSLTKTDLVARLAPLDWWDQNQWHTEKGGIDWLRIVAWLTGLCYERGLYDPASVRGRGAWLDDGRVVLHNGDHLVVDGAETALNGLKSAFVYELRQRMRIPYEQPLTADQARALVDICALLPFDNPNSPALVAGWLALAPICGALAWRPHLWITAPSGGGKTWAMEHVFRPVLGGAALHVQSVTTEAGIRQALGHDARPILFDEAETQTPQGQDRMQRVLELARQASSDGGAIIKGTAGGRPQTFAIRSCFLMSSIGPGVTQRADQTRVTVIEMRPPASNDPEAVKRFERLQALTARTLTADWLAGLHARVASMAPVVRANAETFAQAFQHTPGATRRMGDQLGALLGGYWALWSDDPITLDEAREQVLERNWSDYLPDAEETDERICLDTLLHHRTRVELEIGKPPVERTVGELVEMALRVGPYVRPSDSDAASVHLRRLGIRVEPAKGARPVGLSVATRHPALGEIYGGGPFAVQWGRYLSRIPGAESGRATKAVKFSGGVVARAVFVPLCLDSSAGNTEGNTPCYLDNPLPDDELPLN